MARRRAPYPAEFRHQMVEFVRAGRTPEELSREFEPSAQAIRNWVARADRDEGRRADGLSTPEREELRRLKRENRRLRQERGILAIGEEGQRMIRRIIRPTNAWFARETGSIPPKTAGGSSSS